jgi:hypothetical protein
VPAPRAEATGTGGSSTLFRTLRGRLLQGGATVKCAYLRKRVRPQDRGLGGLCDSGCASARGGCGQPLGADGHEVVESTRVRSRPESPEETIGSDSPGKEVSGC